MFHVFFLAYTPLPSPLNDVTFGKMSGDLEKNSDPFPRFWDLEEFPAPVQASTSSTGLYSDLEEFRARL